MTITLKFEKDSSSRWYVVLPDWEGKHSDLEMVCGADTMLDIEAQGESEVYLTLSNGELPKYKSTLKLIREEFDGGTYLFVSEFNSFEVWLCFVTKHVFNEIPKLIYIK